MANVIVKKVETEEEQKFVADQTFYAFSPSPGSQDQQMKRREYFKSAVEFIVLEDGKPMSTSNYVPMTQNIRGKIFTMGGVAGVASYPEARRKGYVKLLMNKMFQEMRAEKRPISILYPFRQSFYARFGYITSEQEVTAIFSPSNLKSIMKIDTGLETKRTDFIESIDQRYSLHLDTQKQWHGFSMYDKQFMKVSELNPSWVVFVYDQMDIVGAMTYKITGFGGKMRVFDFLYLTSEAKYSLLQWIGKHVDHVSEVEMPLNPNYKLETWVDDLDLQTKTRDWVASHMFRVISVDDLSGMNVGEGSFDFQLVDPHCAWNNGNWSFVSINGKLVVKATSKVTDDVLTINGLSAIIYGVYNINDFKIKGWGNLSQNAMKVIKNMFPMKLPFISKMV